MTAPRVRLVVFPFIVVLLATIVSAPAFADKRVALVVGNSAYQNVTPLDNPKNDARLMADTLRSVGFSLVGGGAQLDLDKGGIDRAVRAFGAQLQGADVGLFYYAGHGVQISGVNYLVPVDANPVRQSDVDFQMLDANVILRQMADSGTKLNLVILDACRNNPFGGRGLRGGTRGLAQMQAPEGTLISFATQPGNVAQDGVDGDSPYTKALAQTIRKPGLDVFRTFNEVGLAVASATSGTQQPWVSLSPIKGDFYFTGSPGSVAAQPSASANPAADEIFWLMIKNSRVAALFDEFLKDFPASEHVAEARARLEELNKREAAQAAKPVPQSPDEATWVLLKETTDEAALKRFTAQYPNSPLRKDAEARIAALEAIVDPVLVGTFKHAAVIDDYDWRFIYTIAPDGTYRLVTTQEEDGSYSAANGRYRTIGAKTGHVRTGTYRAVGSAAIEMRSAAGTAIFRPTQSTAPIDQVHPVMLGIWRATIVQGGMTTTLTIQNNPDGTYHYDGRTEDNGSCVFANQQWRTISAVTGKSTAGTYRLVDARNVEFTDTNGSTLWQRQ